MMPMLSRCGGRRSPRMRGMAARSSRRAPGCCTASGCVATGAREHLLAAAVAFARMGARPWQERAEAELRAAGAGAPAVTADDPLARLTPQELQVVRLAAAGASNKQIGAQLFLSPRTVGFHLYRAFPKL